MDTQLNRALKNAKLAIYNAEKNQQNHLTGISSEKLVIISVVDLKTLYEDVMSNLSEDI